MSRSFLVAALWLSFLSCKKEPAAVAELAVAEAAAKFAASQATPVDANTDEYRQGAGWVPGAVLLTSFNDYPLTELPEDKNRQLVFYCTSRM
jgi:hypothetical protein